MKGKTVRLNLDNPDDMAHLLRSGAIWNLPMFWQKAVDALKSGLVPVEECKNIPPQVLEFLRK